jgi:L-ascorbate metabolism protein UlaG (beta-lactamase superfamily)
MRLWVILLYALAAEGMEIRYLAHASFEIRSEGGTRLVLDPYNSHVWLGYRFPENVAADVVLVSHPHFDHDAWYYIRGFPAVFRNSGVYTAGDVEIEGIRGKHADPYGGEFGQINTIWMVETGGVRLAHLGDNGPLTPENIRALGRVDVLFAPVDETEHILKFREVEAIVAALHPRVVVPMHYRIGAAPEDLGGIDAWVAKQARARAVGNRALVRARDLPEATTVYRFEPAAGATPWSEQFWEAIRRVRQFNRLLDQTKGKPSREQLSEVGPALVEAASREPGFIAGWHARAMLARLEGRVEEAIGLLQRGLTAAYPDDTERTTLARALLADLLAEQGRRAEARVQWAELLRTSHRADVLERARRGLAEETAP